MAGRYSKGQKVRVPDALVTEQGFKDYAGLVGEALGETGGFATDYDRAVFTINGRESVGLFAGRWLEPVPTFSKGDTVRVLNNDNSPRHHMEVGTIGIVTEVNTTQMFGDVARVKGEGRGGRFNAHQWVHVDSLELVETPDLVDPNVEPLNGLTRGDRVVFTDTDRWHEDYAHVGDRATFYGHRFSVDDASVLRMDDGRVFVAWSSRIKKWDGTTAPEAEPEAEPFGGNIPVGKVGPGDHVTMEHPDGSRIINREVKPARSVYMGRRQEFLTDLLAEGWRITAHEPKPEGPKVPTTVGSVIRDDVNDGLTMMLTDDGWIDQEGDRRTPAGWTGDRWSLIHDAGAES